MTLETRVKNLENFVTSLMNNMQNNKFYTDTDVAGVRQNVSEITPYTETKRGYYQETEKVFYDAPVGKVTVFFDNYIGSYNVNRIENRLIVSFDALEEETDITISIQ